MFRNLWIQVIPAINNSKSDILRYNTPDVEIQWELCDTNIDETQSTTHLGITVHSTYTEMLQINEQIKLYTIYTNTVNRQMELAGRTDYHIYISNKFT
jgi:hypothetical protein